MQGIKTVWTKSNLGLLLLSTTLIASHGVAAAVKSKSPEEFVQYGPEDAYFAFTATCDDDAKRVVQRKTDGNEWCVKGIKGFCDENKETAAEQACSSELALAMGTVQSSQKEADAAKQAEAERTAQAAKLEQERLAKEEQERARAADLERERAAARVAAQEKARKDALAAQSLKKKVQVEEELLKIDEELLELRQKDLDLQQRQTEIAEQLTNKK